MSEKENSNSILDELKWRGLLKQVTNEERVLEAQAKHLAVYCGFDPTADSLHIGHLIPLILLDRFQQFGFQPIALIGGVTGMIGDPSFKNAERVLQTDEQVKINEAGISKQIAKLLPKVEIINNATWLNSMSLIDFLRNVGKDFTVGNLLAKESISKRVQTGLSVTEFMYTMLQAYDFYQLYTKHHCMIQLGGSDQWGNITSGTDYIGAKVGRDKTQAAGITMQLLLKKDGKKFGKTETGTVWLDSQKTSVYDFYQFWVNQDDEDSEKMLKFLTFFDWKAIRDLVHQAKQDRKSRIMQKALATELTKFVHGQEGLDQAIKVSEALFKGDLNNLKKNEFLMAFNTLNNIFVDQKTSLIDAIVNVGAASSKREAREFLANKAISINGQEVLQENLEVGKIKPIHNDYLIIRRGKKKFFGLKIK